MAYNQAEKYVYRESRFCRIPDFWVNKGITKALNNYLTNKLLWGFNVN
ncbi:MAG TPA: hypothetical protein PLY48_05365 [Candidatus Cloacimonas acidaminovorans]|nr:hypothetical protein [Candidatus Cloacimonas sp.]NLM90312.1 hypothetical protein [Candidatus Cloacimonadota bacterium]HOI01665.1 hypothetical protein [Candidatus Cloacimonas acidaminovorans]HPX58344.1 hypothetical protein [Candidatus Cloacimonas acidaminovorans]